jgi:ketosteroid isomerase-like protein
MESIREAYEAFAGGDVEPLVALMHPDIVWRGRRPGWRFWRPRPS